MTILHPAEILRGQFTHEGQSSLVRSIRWTEWSLVLVAVAAGSILFALHVETIAAGAVLTATSILTGLTFTMALRFWERRVDIQSAPQKTGYTSRRELIQELSTHLIWTVFVGVVSTAWTGFAALVSDRSLASWATAITATLLTYQLLLVAESLGKMYTSSIELG